MVPRMNFQTWIAEDDTINRAIENVIVDVSLEDRALVILRTNMTEVSHSLDTVGVEVFAEPNSHVCVFAAAGPQGEEEVYNWTSTELFGLKFWTAV